MLENLCAPKSPRSKGDLDSVLSISPDSVEIQRLKTVFRGLDAEDRALLLAFAELLDSRRRGRSSAPDDHLPLAKPLPEPRPPSEAVIAAIRRLSQSYPMLDRGAMLDETSSLMSAHVLHGRKAPEVIDELEALFARHYEAFRTRAQGADPDSSS
jgi:hypothetical protein